MSDSFKLESFLTSYSLEVGSALLQMHQILMASYPEMTIEIDHSAKLVGYLLGAGYKGVVFVLIPSKKGVKLGFPEGIAMENRLRLLKGEGKKSRYIELNVKQELDFSQYSYYLDQAVVQCQIRLAQ